MKIKTRLDLYIAEHYPQYSRSQIQSWIMQGKVRVDNAIITKSGAAIAPDAQVVLDVEEPKFVCRAGFKLEQALSHFAIDVQDKIILDAGLSTGGFTDCLLQLGARKVYGVDVGYGQVHEKIRQDPRVIVLERTNLRHLTTVGERVDIVTLDLSFISLIKVMDAVKLLLKDDGILITLVKPQFEAERHQVGKGGIIKDPKVHKSVVERVTQDIADVGFVCKGVIESPILGGSGNREFLAYFVRSSL